jgi:acyl-coenzyme A thioesterase PaaI-like protein
MAEHLPYTHNCFVCGVDNPHGLHLRFSSANDEVTSDFTPRVEHAGYPGVLHGGVVGAALDEAMFWAATHGVSRMHLSAELTVRYRKKVEVGCSYRLVARIVKAARSMCRTEAELLDADSEVCANATGKYLPLPKEDVDLVLRDFHADDSTVPLERYLANRD